METGPFQTISSSISSEREELYFWQITHQMHKNTRLTYNNTGIILAYNQFAGL